MRICSTKLAVAGVFALAGAISTPAMAGAPMGFSGVLGASFSNTSCSGCGSQNGWGINGQGAFGLGMSDLGAEIDGNYTGYSGSGSPSVAGVGGNLFWAPMQGRVGASVNWSQLDAGGPNLDTTSYGAFGEYYLSNAVTVGGFGGGLNLSVSGASAGGSYFGGGLTGYLMPDVAVTGAINYSNIDKGIGTFITYSIAGEWLVSETTPVAVSVGYSYIDLPHGLPSGNVFTIALKYYAGQNGTSLVDHHRNGALDSVVAPSTLGLRTLF